MRIWHEVQHRIGVGCIHHAHRDAILAGWHTVMTIGDGWDTSKTPALLNGLRAESEPGEDIRFVTHTETTEVFNG
jgi:hypothetical protein